MCLPVLDEPTPLEFETEHFATVFGASNIAVQNGPATYRQKPDYSHAFKHLSHRLSPFRYQPRLRGALYLHKR
ncbi:MAG: hypothetical protein ACI8PT_002469 [Gammaproteobacteria bacterium]|jgi:hypothetical protein